MALSPAERKRLERERKEKDQIAVRGTIHKSDKPKWDEINVETKNNESSES